MNDKKPDIEKIASEILARGNDVEIRTCKEGMKIIEVSRKVVLVIKNDAENGRR